jgi:cytoskeleton protein RodZ
MKKTGQILREAREAKSISLQEISIHLKINTKTLKALEMGDKTQLPAKTFLRGFVQSYAQFLRLDLNQIMDVFQEEMGSTHPGMITSQIQQTSINQTDQHNTNQVAQNNINAHFQSVPKAPSIPPTSSKNIQTSGTANKSAATTPTQTSGSKVQVNEPLPPSSSFDPQTWSHSLKIGTAILVLIIISGIIIIKKTIDKYEREATLPKQDQQLEGISSTNQNTVGTIPPSLNISPDESALASQPINSPLSTVTIVAPEESIANETKPEQIISTGATTTNTTTTAVTTVPTVTAATSPTIKATDGTAAVTLTETTATATPTAVESSPQEVIIEALDKLVVEYSIDGGPKNSISLSAEKIHTFKAKRNLSLSFSDGGSVNLIHNGKDKGVPGHLGQPYTVSFPQ